jgi:2,4-dienoyl-CoA reductase-like NADH-dependent reductase (Old Yellow Enzyme family)
MSEGTIDKLFTGFKAGAMDLRHRIVMAPLTRMRATPETFVPTDLMATYYEQRASVGGLIITEATQICQEGQG